MVTWSCHFGPLVAWPLIVGVYSRVGLFTRKQERFQYPLQGYLPGDFDFAHAALPPLSYPESTMG